MINDCQQSCNSRGTLCATFLVLLGVVITKVWHQTRVDPCYFCSGILLQQGLDGRLSVLSAFRICFSATGADEKEGPVAAHQRRDSTTWGQFFWLTLFFRFHRWSPSQQPLSLLNYYKSWTPDSQYGGGFFFSWRYCSWNRRTKGRATGKGEVIRCSRLALLLGAGSLLLGFTVNKRYLVMETWASQTPPLSLPHLVPGTILSVFCFGNNYGWWIEKVAYSFLFCFLFFILKWHTNQIFAESFVHNPSKIGNIFRGKPFFFLYLKVASWFYLLVKSDS